MTTTLKQPLVSVIMPIYNVDKYLEESLDSIIAQSYTNIEILLIDDGSIDGSLAICHQYEARDDRVKVIHQANQGVSVARNRGIDLATGDYITFVDPDDSLTITAVQYMVDMINQHSVDAVRTSYLHIRGDIEEDPKEITPPGVKKGIQLKELKMSAIFGDIGSYVWLLLIKKSKLDKANIRFPVNISMMEDYWFYFDLLSNIDSIYVGDSKTYRYRVNESGALRSIVGFKEKIQSIISVNKYIVKNIDNADDISRVQSIHISNIASALMVRVDNATLKETVNMLNILQENKNVKALYELANKSYLGLYDRLAVKATVNGSVASILILKLIRKMAGK